MKSIRLPLVTALVLTLVAGGLAWMRKSEMVQERTPADFKIENLNNLTWDPATGIFEVTGGDPYGTIEIPRASFPLDELRLEFKGNAQPGGWYVYASPEHLPLKVDQDQVITAVAETTPTGHALVWTMSASLLARIDFPDELAVPMQLERAVFRTRFLSSTSWTFSAAAIAAGLSALILFWIILRPVLHLRPVFWVVCLALTGAKLWLSTDVGISLNTNLMHDDLLFMNQAMSISAGEWLGNFGQLTLAKGPTYSIFLALSSFSGVSLLYNEVLFQSVACIIFVWALSPWLIRAEWRLLLLFVLLFEPHSYSDEMLGRILRGAIQPSLSLLTLAGLVGMVTRARKPPSRIWPWATLAGIAGGAFWYSREEGIWLVPTCLLLWGTGVIAGWHRPSAQRASWLACLLLPLIVFLGFKFTIRSLNLIHYGVAIGVDVSEGSFPAAYGAMLRVQSPDPMPSVPITAATRKLIYPHSPAFAQLAEALEGPLTGTWGQAGWNLDPDHPRAFKEIRGGWYQWAIRQAALQKGHYQSARSAQAYWQQVADEINAAIDSGQLAGGKPRHGFFPVWQDAYTRPTIATWFKALDLIARFTDFRTHGSVSQGRPIDIDEKARFLHLDPLIKPKPATPEAHTRTVIYRVFATVGWHLTLLALFATGVVLRRSRRDTLARAQAAVLFSLWGGAAALLLVVSLVHVTSFWALTGNYLGPAGPIVISCWILAPLWAWGTTSPSPAPFAP